MNLLPRISFSPSKSMLAATLVTIGSLAGGANAAVITTGEDLTSSGVIIVDSSSSTRQFSVAAGATDIISDVTFTANLTGSGEQINSDGTLTDATGNPYMNELYLLLKSPSGTILELISQQTYDSNTPSIALATLNFSDGGSSQSGSLSAGTFAATGGSFSVFDGEPAAGIWEVTVGDTAFFDPKSLNGYSISITTTRTFTAVPEPSSAALLGLGGLALMLRRRR